MSNDMRTRVNTSKVSKSEKAKYMDLARHPEKYGYYYPKESAEIDAYVKKVHEFDKQTKDFTMDEEEKKELIRQIRVLGIRGTLVDMDRGIRINKGKTNYDVYYDRGKDLYVVFKVTHSSDMSDFKVERFDDVYAEDLPNFIQ